MGTWECITSNWFFFFIGFILVYAAIVYFWLKGGSPICYICGKNEPRITLKYGEKVCESCYEDLDNLMAFQKKISAEVRERWK